MLLASSGFVTLVLFAVWLFAIFDAVTCPEARIRGLQKPLWILVILLLFIVGAAAWFAFGKVRVGAPTRAATFGGLRGFSGSPRSGGSSDDTVQFGGPPRRSGRPIAPDDDIEFLRSLNRPNDKDKPAS